jgi:hypothetical protein
VPSARRRPASLGAVKSETSANQFAPVTDANFLEYPAPMDREMLKRHLALAEEHIATGEKNIARQRDLIAQLERDGHDTASARTFLREFEQLQALHIAERERLLSELSEL